jgi:tetratricopeptide (TPR) repeat protein
MRRGQLILIILLLGINCFGQNTDKVVNDGVLKCKLRDYRNAVIVLNQAIKNNPNSYDAFYFRGVAKSELRDYKSAVSDFTKAIELKPGNINAYYERGIVRKRLGDYSGARSDFAKGKEINPASSFSDYREGHRPSFTLSDTVYYKSLHGISRERFLNKYSVPDSIDVFEKRGFDLYSFFYFHVHDTCWIYFTGNSLQSIMYFNGSQNLNVIEY